MQQGRWLKLGKLRFMKKGAISRYRLNPMPEQTERSLMRKIHCRVRSFNSTVSLKNSGIKVTASGRKKAK
jgi:hypothetical protein